MSQPKNHPPDDRNSTAGTSDPAVDVLRGKINALFNQEPSAKEELKEVNATSHRSKHQQFMFELSSSGKPLAEIQTAWHNYYVNLPDGEKHEVWQEFYAQHDKQPAAMHQTARLTHHQKEHTSHQGSTKNPSLASARKRILRGTRSGRTKQRSAHMRSLLFGLGMGSAVVVVFLFGFFNERFIAPFITPSKSVSSTPIIIDPDSTAVGAEPKLIIPKINAELPVVYDEPSIEEAAVQRALERGVLHYATTPKPGEQGNGVIFGHSSNNILNRGQYKFAFVLLRQLENGDTFYVQKDGTRYAYKVYEKKVVAPTEVSVLGSAGKASTFTLITCDPPGSSAKRLVVIGEQISPDPGKNVASTATTASNVPNIIPSNAPSLWQRITNWFTS